MLGDDWPPFSPLKLERKVEMVVEESVHYVAGGLGGGTGKAEWQYQRGFGYDGAARLGPDNRTFAVSLFHQEHCLLYLHAQLSDRTKDDDSGGRFAHHQHCLNYLRQQALCHPDLTLEPGDFAAATRDFEVGRVGQTHVCRDFDMAWDYNTEKWLEWYRFLKDSSRIPSECLSRLSSLFLT
jgi:hypothetical protein